MRRLYAITLSLLLLAAPLGSQTQTMILVASESILATYSVALDGLPVISTNASSTTDCTFGSGTGNYKSLCFYCLALSAWLDEATECVASLGYVLREDAGYVLREDGGKIVREDSP